MFNKNHTRDNYSDMSPVSLYSLLLYFLFGKLSFIQLISGLNSNYLGNLAFLSYLICEMINS